MVGNISDISQILIDVKDIDVVFHQAAIASVVKSVQDPNLSLKRMLSLQWRCWTTVSIQK